MQKVGVIGVSQLPFQSRYLDKTYFALSLEAAKKAFADCGLTAKDMDGLIDSIGDDLLLRQQFPDAYILDYLGMNGKRVHRITAGAATEGHALYAAYCQIASGMADVLLVLGVQKQKDCYSFATKSREDGLVNGTSMRSDITWEEPLMPHLPPAGDPATESLRTIIPHMQKYNSPTEQQMAKVAVKNRSNAMVNPNAQLREKLTIEEALNSKTVVWPTTEAASALFSEGAAALVLASEKKTREISRSPVWLTGVAVSNHSRHHIESETLGRMPSTAIAANKAYKMAGIKDPLHELDVIELHDLSAGLEIIEYEELGLCQLGEGGKLVDSGITNKTGQLPVNPSGGRIACGHAEGVSGISSACDVVLQLREKAGPIQVSVKKGKGLVQCVSSCGSLAGVAIFERDN